MPRTATQPATSLVAAIDYRELYVELLGSFTGLGIALARLGHCFEGVPAGVRQKLRDMGLAQCPECRQWLVGEAPIKRDLCDCCADERRASSRGGVA